MPLGKVTKVPGKISLLLMCCLIFFLGYTYAFDDEDFQYWNTESLTVKINDRWKATLEEDLRFGDDARQFAYHHTDIGLAYSGITSWLDLGLNYRHVSERKNNGWKTESRPHFNATIKAKTMGLNISNRAKFEYRNREEADNLWRYANKITFILPAIVSQLNIRPYVANEIFIDFDAGELNQNRIYAGLQFTITKNLNCELFYLRLSAKKTQWTDSNILGTKLKLSF